MLWRRAQTVCRRLKKARCIIDVFLKYFQKEIYVEGILLPSLLLNKGYAHPLCLFSQTLISLKKKYGEKTFARTNILLAERDS
jgi:hypothetical protein